MKLRRLAEENVPATLVAALEEAGDDLVWVRTAAPGALDSEVLAQAVRERRILLTFDKGFGALVAEAPLPPNSGVVLLRVTAPKDIEIARGLAARISTRDWVGHSSVIEPGRVRRRRFQP